MRENHVKADADGDRNGRVQDDGAELVARERRTPQHNHKARSDASRQAREEQSEGAKGASNGDEERGIGAQAREQRRKPECPLRHVEAQKHLIGEAKGKQRDAEEDHRDYKYDKRAGVCPVEKHGEGRVGPKEHASAEHGGVNPCLMKAIPERKRIELARGVSAVFLACDGDSNVRKSRSHISFP